MPKRAALLSHVVHTDFLNCPVYLAWDAKQKKREPPTAGSCKHRQKAYSNECSLQSTLCSSTACGSAVDEEIMAQSSCNMHRLDFNEAESPAKSMAADSTACGQNFMAYLQ